MLSNQCERAIADALKYGNALLKFISANDSGETGGHQAGFYLPRPMWKMFTPHPPTLKHNAKHDIAIMWPDGKSTKSVVTWYGAAKSEYRLTRFGKDFQWLSPEMVGDMLVLIRKSAGEFIAYILSTDEEIAEIQAALGLEIGQSWAAYPFKGLPKAESPNRCIERQFREYASRLEDFPTTTEMSEATRKAMENCIRLFRETPFDDQLVQLIEGEYDLFKMIETHICLPQISHKFAAIDEFIETASSIMNRRKARAGRSLENHFAVILGNAAIPFDQRVRIDGAVEPDILIPGKRAYEDSQYPAEKLCLLGLKTTCKDRWRQVLNEGQRVKKKHILTLQKGISVNQLNEMHDSGITLVVPTEYQKFYPRTSRMSILTVGKFMDSIKRLLV